MKRVYINKQEINEGFKITAKQLSYLQFLFEKTGNGDEFFKIKIKKDYITQKSAGLMISCFKQRQSFYLCDMKAENSLYYEQLINVMPITM